MNTCNISLFKHFHAVQNCNKCQTLSPWKKFSHKWKGNIHSKAMIISEAPGSNSICNKRMWTGSSGMRLRNILKELGIILEDIFYMTDVVKCQPPNNRDPFGDEINTCAHFLHAEIKFLKPKIILSFGRFALDYLTNYYKPIDKIPSGTITQLHTRDGYLKIKFEKFEVIPLIHPSAANRVASISYTEYKYHLKEIFYQIINAANDLEKS